ncbi:MAG: ketoacyl-ACP synthase III [Synergistaceae bacterium]|nr:ketoacyl-ACP synthase III [Synergistaceae bacterium]
MRTISGVSLKALACAVPGQKFTLTEYAPNLVDEKSARQIENVSGFRELRISPDEMTTSDLCVPPAMMMLDDFGRENVGAVVFVSKTPDYVSPATSHILQARLGLPSSVLCLDINEGCSGFVAGLYVSSLIAGKINAPVLLCGGDTNSKLTSPNDRATRCIFGDAGFAGIVAPETGAGDTPFRFANFGERAYSIIMENSRHRITGHPRNNGCYFMDGAAVMNFALTEVPAAVRGILTESGYVVDDITLYAFHQCNRLILSAVAKKLGIPPEKSPFTAGDTGNTSSASIPLLLADVAGNADMRRVICAGFGVGLSVGVCIADFSRTKFFTTTEI